jgi:branched-chain amino acid transport system permease protein
MLFLASPRPQAIALALILLISAAVVTLTQSKYALLIWTLVPIWAVFGLSWNVLGGYAGLISFGHAAFFGLGAFTVAILAKDYGVTPWIGLPLSSVVGCLSGMLVGAATFRLRGFYFALAMLAYPLALLNLFEWAGWIELAIPMHRDAPWTFMQFEDARVLPLIALAFFGVAMAVSLQIERTRFGLLLFAIRQDEMAAQTAGIATFGSKMRAIAISGALAGGAGGLYALAILVVTPASVFGMLVSAQALIIPMFGGRGTAWGAAIGAAVLIPLSEFLHAELGSQFPGIAGVVFGAAIILVVILMPQGIFWTFADWRRRRRPMEAPQRPTAAPKTAATVAAIQAGSGSEAGQALLEVRNVSVTFGGVNALQNVSFSIHHREIVGIIGPNGAGKTTLFNVLSGLVQPTAGEAVFAGRALIGERPDRICAFGVGRTFQTVRYFPRLTLLENVVAGAFTRFGRDREALQQTWVVLDRVGLGPRAMKLASELNNRELRLMELARALASKPRILLLDECLAGLSTEDIDYMMSVLRTLPHDNVTVVIIEHTMHAMAKLAERLIVLDQGSVIVSGPPMEVLKRQEVIAAYLGKRWAAYAAA